MVSVLAQACPKCGSPNKRPSVGSALLIAGAALIAVVMVAALWNAGDARRSRNHEVKPSPSATPLASNHEEPSAAVEVPAYEIVDDIDLAPKSGRRILVNVKDPDLTDAQCAAIIARLRPRAGREGEVAVRIPLHNDRPERRFFPLCYDDLDGKGVQEGTARQMQRAFDKTVTEVITVSADQLHKDYSANEVSADERYRNKLLRVTGAVQSIGKDILDEPYVVLWTTNEFEGVQAHFDDTKRLSSLSKGDHITVRCRGNNVILNSPQLKDCVLE